MKRLLILLPLLLSACSSVQIKHEHQDKPVVIHTQQGDR